MWVYLPGELLLKQPTQEQNSTLPVCPRNIILQSIRKKWIVVFYNMNVSPDKNYYGSKMSENTYYVILFMWNPKVEKQIRPQ